MVMVNGSTGFTGNENERRSIFFLWCLSTAECSAFNSIGADLVNIKQGVALIHVPISWGISWSGKYTHSRKVYVILQRNWLTSLCCFQVCWSLADLTRLPPQSPATPLVHLHIVPLPPLSRLVPTLSGWVEKWVVFILMGFWLTVSPHLIALWGKRQWTCYVKDVKI